MSGNGQTLYVKIDQNSIVRDRAVRLEDVAKAECTEIGILRKVKQMEIYRFPGEDQDAKAVHRVQKGSCPDVKNFGSRGNSAKKPSAGKKKISANGSVCVFSVLEVIEKIHQLYPSLEIVNLGAPDFVVRYEPNTENPAAQYAKTALLCIVLFFGAAFTIMTFIQDVAVGDVFNRFYEQVTGYSPAGLTSLEVSFCIGLAVGIMIFYNHIGRKKLTDDPTPIQVEMRKYEQDVDNTYIEASSRKGKSIDVDN